MKIVKPGDRTHIKALIYGPAGHGKTTFIATAQYDPRTYPMLYLDFEGGEQSLVGLDIDMVSIRDWQDFNQVYKELVSGKTEYKSVGVDSLSETHLFALLDILTKEGPKRPDPDALQQQDYGKATIQMRRLTRRFRDLPMHIFFTSGAKDDVEPRVGQVKKPALAGQLSEEVSGMMDCVAYLALSKDEDGEEMRSLLLHGISQFRIKVRTGWGVEVAELIDEPEPGAFRERGVTLLMDELGFPGGETRKRKRRAS